MSLGVSIFLSSIVLSVLILFIVTKDRWNWKIIIKRFSVTAVLLIIAIAVIGTGIYKFNNRPKVQSEFWELKLGQSPSDVRYLKGKNYAVIQGKNDDDHDSVFYYLDKSKYSGDKEKYFVVFTSGKISGILCAWDGTPYVPSIQGIGRYSDEDDIRKKFGEPDTITESDDGLTRFWKYKKYKVRFNLKRGKLSALGIYEPKLRDYKKKIAVGTIKDGYKYLGGNINDSISWGPVSEILDTMKTKPGTWTEINGKKWRTLYPWES